MQERDTCQVFQFLQEPSVLFLKAFTCSVSQLPIKSLPWFPSSDQKTLQTSILKAKDTFRKISWVFKLLMFLSTCQSLQLFLAEPVMCQLTLAFSRSQTVQDISELLPLSELLEKQYLLRHVFLHDAGAFYLLRHQLQLWSNSKSEIKVEKERFQNTITTCNFASWVFP